MDYTDGSKEAKLLQELLHIIEEAMLRGGGVQGNFAELIWKEMKEKGPDSGDFCTLLIAKKYEKQYDRMLKEEGVKYLKIPDVNGNITLTLRTEDRLKALDVDACIKKGSSDHTRAEYVAEFLKDERRRGRAVYRLRMSDQQTHEMLANKSFSHPAGFVSAYSDGYCYFSESAADSEIAGIFLDTAISTAKGTLLGNVKQANFRHEAANYSRVMECLERGDTMNFVNIFDNRSDYLHVEDGVLQVYSYKSGLLDVVETIDPKEYEDGMQENMHEVIRQKLAKIHNCECIGDRELEAHLNKSQGQLDAEHETALYEASGLVADLEGVPDPMAVVGVQGVYLETDRKVLQHTGKLLKERLDAAEDASERAELARRLDANSKLIVMTEARDELLGRVKKETGKMRACNSGYASLSNEGKLKCQREMALYALRNMELPEVGKYLDASGMDLDGLVAQYEGCFGKIEQVPDAEAEQIIFSAGMQTQAQPNPMM